MPGCSCGLCDITKGRCPQLSDVQRKYVVKCWHHEFLTIRDLSIVFLFHPGKMFPQIRDRFSTISTILTANKIFDFVTRTVEEFIW